jgi:hypothetical protein
VALAANYVLFPIFVSSQVLTCDSFSPTLFLRLDLELTYLQLWSSGYINNAMILCIGSAVIEVIKNYYSIVILIVELVCM